MKDESLAKNLSIIPTSFAFNRDTGEDFSAAQKKFDREKARSYFELAKNELGAENFELGLLYSNDGGAH